MAKRNSIHKSINSRKAPQPIGPYVQAVHIEKPGETLFVSGQIPIEMPSGELFLGDIQKQTEICLTHIKNIVADAGFTMDHIVKVSIFLTDMGNFAKVNEVYSKFFMGQSVPAREAIEVAGLPKGVNVEISCIAVKPITMGNLFG